MNAFFRVVWIVVRKDVTVEVRSLELLLTTVFFAVTVVLMFSFGLVVRGSAIQDVAPAILWIAVAFSGTLALGRTFERERQNDTLRALLLAPADRPALYVGKLVGILLLLMLVEIVLATHDLDIADQLLTKAVFLIDGRPVADSGSGRSLRERYETAVRSALV